MESYLDIDITAKYGDQLISIMEKMTNGTVNIIVTGEEKSILLTKSEFVEVCKELNDKDQQISNG